MPGIGGGGGIMPGIGGGGGAIAVMGGGNGGAVSGFGARGDEDSVASGTRDFVTSSFGFVSGFTSVIAGTGLTSSIITVFDFSVSNLSSEGSVESEVSNLTSEGTSGNVSNLTSERTADVSNFVIEGTGSGISNLASEGTAESDVCSLASEGTVGIGGVVFSVLFTISKSEVSVDLSHPLHKRSVDVDTVLVSVTMVVIDSASLSVTSELVFVIFPNSTSFLSISLSVSSKEGGAFTSIVGDSKSALVLSVSDCK